MGELPAYIRFVLKNYMRPPETLEHFVLRIIRVGALALCVCFSRVRTLSRAALASLLHLSEHKKLKNVQPFPALLVRCV